MRILLIQNETVDLYAELVASETSRTILRFYRPGRVHCGVVVTTASLGSALSLISELRWYIRRYVREVLFEIAPGVYCTQALAEGVYHRDVKLETPWPRRLLYEIVNGRLARTLPMEAGTEVSDYAVGIADASHMIEVWDVPEEAAPRRC
ncbi:MAG: DUF5804 family protein [Methanomicrobiales archaeon]|nr:DUF5804 family protein [Methanomicrobiales archaeon]MDI6877563.1 DUF5804 family protein [Methanomicrobiales archaeon]